MDRASSTGEAVPATDLHLLQRIFLMLCGFAVENFCKAVVVVQLSERENERVRTGGAIPGQLKSHKLNKLLKQLGFVVRPEDDQLATRLEEAIVWRGRYPVPLNPSGLRPKTALGEELWAHSMGSDEIRRSIDFVQQVGSFMRQRCGARTS